MTPGVFDGMLFGSELLFIPMALAVYAILSKDTVRRLIAFQITGMIAAIQLVLLSIAFGTDSFADLGITLGLLSTGGAFVYAHFLERWL